MLNRVFAAILVCAFAMQSQVAVSKAVEPVVETDIAIENPEQPAAEAPTGENPVEQIAVKLFSAEWWAMLVAAIGSIYSVMWVLGELLTRIAVKTKNTWDNKVAQWIGNAVWWLGSVAGALGVRMPKLSILASARTIAAKDEIKAQKKAAKKAAKAKKKEPDAA